MRDILFRAKHRDGDWLYGYYIGDEFIDDGIAWDFIPETVGQYTGLTDINGKKIFEGDIIKDKDGKIGYVKFLDGGFRWDVVKGDLCCYPCMERKFVNLFHWEVIGTIHDNPELLEEENGC